MAARMFFCREESVVRSTVLTGFFTGAAICGAAEAEGAAICAGAEPARVNAKPSVIRSFFIWNFPLLVRSRRATLRQPKSLLLTGNTPNHTPFATAADTRKKFSCGLLDWSAQRNQTLFCCLASSELAGTPGGEVRDGSRRGAKALTRGGRGPYHGGMRLRTGRTEMLHAGAWLLLAMSFAGCEDAAKRPVKAHAPALEPSPD